MLLHSDFNTTEAEVGLS